MIEKFRDANTDNLLRHAKNIYKKHIKTAQNRKQSLRGVFGREKPATH